MCFHSKQSKDAQALEKRYQAKFDDASLLKTGDFNGFQHPSMAVISNIEPAKFQFFQWGLIPHWASDASNQKNTLNARMETINEKSSFRNYTQQRCLIPSDGFYEWKWLDSKGKSKQKYLLHLPGEAIFSLAGLWSSWTERSSGKSLYTFSILTTAANELMSEIHNTKKRMPVIIDPSAENEWLRSGETIICNHMLQARKINEQAFEQLSLF